MRLHLYTAHCHHHKVGIHQFDMLIFTDNFMIMKILITSILYDLDLDVFTI